MSLIYSRRHTQLLASDLIIYRLFAPGERNARSAVHIITPVYTQTWILCMGLVGRLWYCVDKLAETFGSEKSN